MLNDLANSDLEDLSDEPDVPCRYVRVKSEENGQFAWKMGKVPVYAAVDTRQTGVQLDLMSALKSGLKLSQAELRRESRSDTQEGKERSRERITSDVSKGERDKNIQLEQRAWEKRCAVVLKIGIFFRFAEFNCDGFDEEISFTQFGSAF
ncbi:uncharacterized protein MONOS_15706 [Monocercomonoides exilis]|uniref:uncharacterized protein n=1 Tax=Monocercomonoides exilis TaxID=2049356 RepID=UPI003559AC25|nr:hypothetical protein MONOS_15706 [Monocercomonoides exilis]|eukprot:MONOS_15706.1-p1 / transcript=MONOS_15706.1 / gene=MONOS_15706 / organism=Monocercomonoides_exilis_PA203 / gene_product=unspecified product / transcript_product=unspecified product / location=Mono_scaffold01319:1021-1470(-) / protein_length=150 / sequence_SO=supercontig / SO=protein_coding / is_pseudo=false